LCKLIHRPKNASFGKTYILCIGMMMSKVHHIGISSCLTKCVHVHEVTLYSLHVTDQSTAPSDPHRVQGRDYYMQTTFNYIILVFGSLHRFNTICMHRSPSPFLFFFYPPLIMDIYYIHTLCICCMHT
jgi:hypothetical protein